MLELASLIAHHAHYRPDALAVVSGEERLTYRMFAARIARVGNMLRTLGVGRGDKVATLAANSLDLLTTYWAVPTIGATLVPLSPLLTASGLATMLKSADVRCLVAESSTLSVLDAIRETLPSQVLLLDGTAPDCGDFRALAGAASETLDVQEAGPDDLFNIMYTSGTTGLPKGIMHTHFVRSACTAC